MRSWLVLVALATGGCTEAFGLDPARREYARAVRSLRTEIVPYAKLNDTSSGRLAAAQFALAQALWETGERPAARVAVRDAETTAALALVKARVPLGRNLLASRLALLANIERWRDAHR